MNVRFESAAGVKAEVGTMIWMLDLPAGHVSCTKTLLLAQKAPCY